MYADSAEFYERLASGNWTEAIECSLACGTVKEPVHQDEVITLRAFRDLCPASSGERHSRIDFFLLGFRTRTIMTEIAKSEHYDLASFEVPPSLPYKALQYTLTVMDKKQHTMMEITTMHHLHMFLKDCSNEYSAYIFAPQHMNPGEYFFFCGYSFLRHLFSVATAD